MNWEAEKVEIYCWRGWLWWLLSPFLWLCGSWRAVCAACFWRFEGVKVARWAVGGVRGRKGERGAENRQMRTRTGKGGRKCGEMMGKRGV